jgi:hypothetical protein
MIQLDVSDLVKSGLVANMDVYQVQAVDAKGVAT